MTKRPDMETVVALAKRRGFVFPGSEIYGGLAGTWDYGPLGVALKENVKRLWWRAVVEERDDVYGLDAAILMHPSVWKASGHVETFTDPLAACASCKRRFRAGREKECPECGGTLSEERRFNLMFETKIGAAEDSAATVYLRPETAQGIFVNFKNVLDAFHPKLPFGIAQIGKAFRNEITPRDFLFRAREFEQMELEYFVRPAEWEEAFEMWRAEMWRWIDAVGIGRERVREVEVPDGERAHYSRRTIDFEYDYPFGRKELYGLAYRTDFDLRVHGAMSNASLSVSDGETGEEFAPHVIEPSLGVDRTILAVLLEAYDEDVLGGERRVVLRLPPSLAPVRAAVFPLLKNKPELVARAREIHQTLRRELPGLVLFDDNGNIGKRYRRQDEIGTPAAITIDFETLADGTVTVRDRDTGRQRRVPAEKVAAELASGSSSLLR